METGNGDAFPGEVYAVLPAGSETIVQVRRKGQIFNVRVMGEASFDIGERVWMRLPPRLYFLYARREPASMPGGNKDGSNRLAPFQEAMKASAAAWV